MENAPYLKEELRAEIERLKAEMDQRMMAYVASQEEDEARIERLRAENKWLYEQMAAQKRTALDKEAEKPDGNPPL